MAALALHALTLALLKDDDFFTALVFEDLGGDFGASEIGRADLKGGTFTDGEDLRNLDDGTGFGVREAVYEKDVAFSDGELLTLGFDGRFHGNKGETTGSCAKACKEILGKNAGVGPALGPGVNPTRGLLLFVNAEGGADAVEEARLAG